MPAKCDRDQVSLHCFMLIMSESPVFTAPEVEQIDATNYGVRDCA